MTAYEIALNMKENTAYQRFLQCQTPADVDDMLDEISPGWREVETPDWMIEAGEREWCACLIQAVVRRFLVRCDYIRARRRARRWSLDNRPTTPTTPPPPPLTRLWASSSL